MVLVGNLFFQLVGSSLAGADLIELPADRKRPCSTYICYVNTQYYSVYSLLALVVRSNVDKL